MLGTQTDLQHLEKSQQVFDYKKMRNALRVPDKEDSTILINLKLAQDAGVLVHCDTVAADSDEVAGVAVVGKVVILDGRRGQNFADALQMRAAGFARRSRS